MIWRDALRAIAVIAPAMLAVGGCGGNGGEKDGPCVFTLRQDSSVALCEDGYASEECSAAQDANYTSSFTSDSTCAALGYTLSCPGDPQGMYRRVCPAG